jgi:putative transposase
MARLPRLLVAGLPHLLSQRAQHGQTIVRDDADRLGLLALLAEAARQQGVAIHAYALRDQRFDLVATPSTAQGLSALMQAVARRHAAAFNRRHARSGGLWEGRFRVAVVEPESWLLHGMAYVESLPAAAAASSAWVSRASHGGLAVAPPVIDPPVYWALGNTPFEREAAYRTKLEHALTSEQLARIEMALRGGWALGSPRFAAVLAAQGGRPTSPRRRGRPAKKATTVINMAP